MTLQLDMFPATPVANDLHRLPEFGPNEFHIHPLGRVEIHADTAFNREGAERLFKIIDKARQASYDAAIFSKFCDIWLAMLRRHTDGEAPYLKAIDGMDREALDLAAQGYAELVRHFVVDCYTSDILGAVFMMCRSNWGGGWADQEFTPWAVVKVMAKATADKVDPERLKSGPPITVHDPACGSGGMLLGFMSHVAEKHGRRALRNVQASGQDIDRLCVTMGRIQMRMVNVPWMLSFMVANKMEMTGGTTK